MRSKLLLASALLLTAAGAASAQKAKAKPAVKACGITAIPMSVGNSWTYEPVAYPYDQLKIDESKRPRPEDLKLLPDQPKLVVITVTAVDVAKDGTATVTLDEKVDAKDLTTQVTCSAAGVVVASPDAFWFAGEPGGGWNLSFDGVERKDITFPMAKGLIHADTNEWHDDFKAKWKRTPTQGHEDANLGTGTLSLERHYVDTGDEMISVKAGTYQAAHKLGLETHGEITVESADPDAKPYELPEGLVTWFWLADGVGPIEVANSFFHGYQLSSFTIK